MTHICLLGDASSVHLQRWARAMRDRGFRISVISAVAHDIDEIPVTVLPAAGALTGWFARVPAVRRELARLAPDIVNAHYITSYGTLAVLGGRRPVVLSAWGSDILVSPRRSRLVRLLTGWVVRRAALITGDSRDVIEAIAGYGTTARVEEVFWGADTERFHPGVPAAGFEIVSLRAWEANYQIDVLLQAFALFRAARPQLQTRLHLLGGGPDAVALQALAAQLGLGDSVVFRGRADDAQMVSTLQRCRVSVSVPRSDATSVSVLESMACGLPVVASDLPANRQWIDPQWLVPVGDAASISRALQRLADEPGTAAEHGARNRDLVERKASRRQQMDLMASLYRSLL